jgi:hypothetical protein
MYSKRICHPKGSLAQIDRISARWNVSAKFLKLQYNAFGCLWYGMIWLERAIAW